MSELRWAQIGLYAAPADPSAVWYSEALRHFGFQFQRLEDLEEDRLETTHVLLLVGRTELDPIAASTVRHWVEQGGTLVVSGSPMGLDGLLGLTGAPVRLTHGMAKVKQPNPCWPADVSQCKYVGGVTTEASTAEVLAVLHDGRPGLTRRRVGSGWAYFWAPHLGIASQLIQQGRSVESFGVGPADGSVVLDDGELKVEDSIFLDFDRDRFRISEESSPFFALPSVDILREVWIRCILAGLQASGRAYTLLWPWRDHAEAVSVWTVEAKHSQFDAFQRVQHLGEAIGIQLAWLSASPGLSTEFYRYLRRAGSEGGLLTGAEDWGDSAADRYRVDHLAVLRASGSHMLHAARPSQRAWRGWVKYYEFLEATAAKLSVAKGGRQPGAAGFAFGTCHPFRPVRFSGEPFSIWELPFQGFIPGMPAGIAESLVQSVKKRHGCLHISGDLSMVGDTQQESLFRHLMTLARQAHMPSVRPTDLIQFLLAQRQLRLTVRKEANGAVLTMTSPTEVDRLSILVGGASIDDAWIGGRSREGMRYERFGVPMVGYTVDLESKMPETLKIIGSVRRAA